MKKFFWFVVGITVGAMAIKQVKENPKAKELADDVSDRAKAFANSVTEGFRDREAEISAASRPAAKTAAKSTKK